MFDSETLLRTSPALVIVPNGGQECREPSMAVYEFLSKSFAYCPTETLYWLSYFKDWQSVAKAREGHAGRQDLVEYEISNLVDAGFIAIKGSKEAAEHDRYLRDWQWGLFAGLYHFTIQDNEFLSHEATDQYQKQLIANSETPRLEWSSNQEAIALPSPFDPATADLMQLFATRRTNRTSTQHAISKAEIAACLYAGLGITGHVETPTGWLPLSMTPSGGARNPFEAYVIVKRGKDIESGVYHYSALHHRLEVTQIGDPPDLAPYLADQDWVSGMSAVIVLVAVFERTMWKYNDGCAYRVVMIEAGHIAQNVMVAATKLGLTVCPTAAICHAPLSDLLGVQSLTVTPVYALTIDKPRPYQDRIEPNMLFERSFALCEDHQSEVVRDLRNSSSDNADDQNSSAKPPPRPTSP